MPCGIARHPVGYHGNAAAFFLVQQLYADAQGVEHLHQVLAQLRVVVVHVAAVEVGHLLRKRRLLLAASFEPALEAAAAVFGKGTPVVDFHRGIQYRFGNGQACDAIDDGCERPCQLSHEIGRGKHPVTQLGRMGIVLDTCTLDKIRHFHAGRAGNLAALAVEAILERIAEEIRVLEPQAFAVRAGLLGAGVQRIYLKYRTIGRADGALHAFLEIVRAGGIFLKVHT